MFKKSEQGNTAYFTELRAELENLSPDTVNKIMVHVDYLARKANLVPHAILEGRHFNVDRQVEQDAIRNIDAILRPTNVIDNSGNPHMATYIGDGLCLVRTKWDGHVVVPTFNVDVTIGILRDGIHEAWTTRVVQELLREGQTYINVGANFGYYTCLGARIVGSTGKVISIEANPHVFCVLMKTIMYGGIVDRVDAYNRAAYLVSNETLDFTFDYQFIGGGHLSGPAETADQSDNPMWSPESLPKLLDENGKWVSSRGLMNSFHVQTLRLDDVTKDLVADLIHCDVEQAEPYVLLGAVDLIRRSPTCKIIFEWSGYAYTSGNHRYQSAVNDMLSFFNEHGYRIRQIRPVVGENGEISVSEYLTAEEFLSGKHGDYIALKPNNDPWSRTM
ncbi:MULTISPECIES: FkbM family methyltransferase [Rhizobium]|uniref:Methyltransferase FkbM domain-containing protein n=1 Tax=Rhizobium favelukesii TaxID=348824 RepID=W6S8L9_9HYPH|nr:MULTISPECIES: FkbM family methyltransferase [Rhizobium]MCA0805692.1 FkbM family methyltransferase [Rhizobium sp. T1473]MCS0463525.1 FkbM family methyltransferase [Rhizobium favelukesii]UFS78981.1 FkbM family methyltransferase [Rhizobium sp. T136]CDM62456.1 hypothetical protein LPU83_pLPU83d_1086 [Rhizobium favelukesii]